MKRGRRKSNKDWALSHKNRIPTVAPASSVAPPPPPWIELPEDLTANILQRLGAKEILESAEKVCSTWRRVCKNPSTWHVIDLDYRRCEDGEEFDAICHCAVDRSQGQLVELKLTSMEEDYGFLNYVADRSSQLRCLTLVGFYRKNDMETDLTDAIRKLPQLEELHLIRMPEVETEQLETIGVSCPMLKSFTYHEHWGEHSDLEDNAGGESFAVECGVAIGKTMPNLRHLRLWTQWMKNEGLEAILNGCPRLESLDLRSCYGLDLEGALGKRCSDRIKHLRLPSDSTSDIDLLIDDPEEYDGYCGLLNSGKFNVSDAFVVDFFGHDGCGEYDGYFYF
ncbi:putative F-box/LRR-repeat protein 23 [Salvia divinorum]|uniref:F-box/LRR-repeat protein 23 n=1 Tax=Salvia divinorum TaxID=28513 RepID=A0ABD1HHK5_SALDI